jgi:hypothetical protein
MPMRLDLLSRHRVLSLVLVGALWSLTGGAADAQTARCKDGSTSHSKSHSGTCAGHKGVAQWMPTAPEPTSAAGPARDTNGRIVRSEEARREFERQTGYPHGRPGYVIDHIIPLACGGHDAPSNMQWQTIAEGKAKDKVERKDCH